MPEEVPGLETSELLLAQVVPVHRLQQQNSAPGSCASEIRALKSATHMTLGLRIVCPTFRCASSRPLASFAPVTPVHMSSRRRRSRVCVAACCSATSCQVAKVDLYIGLRSFSGSQGLDLVQAAQAACNDGFACGTFNIKNQCWYSRACRAAGCSCQPDCRNTQHAQLQKKLLAGCMGYARPVTLRVCEA